MARVVFDTSVLIAYTFREARSDEIKERINRVADGLDIGMISAITVSELFERIMRSGSRETALKLLERIKSSCFVVMDVTEEIAKLSGPLKAKFPQLSTADAIIMSTAYANKAKLYTFDKGFWGIGGVEIMGVGEE